MAENVKLFLSCVSDEFGTYREPLRKELALPDVAVTIQEDLRPQGGDTLAMLEDYIASCAAVVHVVGDMTGAAPPDSCVSALLQRHSDLRAKLPPLAVAVDEQKPISYTHWEAWLALYLGKDMLVVVPSATAPRSPKCKATDESKASQAEHLARLKAIGRFPDEPFSSELHLAVQIFRSALYPALRKALRQAAPSRRPRNLPLPPLGPLFMGRGEALDSLRAALRRGDGSAVVSQALHGLGGIGKTRLAIEYAWRHETEYSALLFVRADEEAAVAAGLAALAGAEILDLPEKEAREDAVKTEAVVRWLETHPTWLLILDNVDDEQAVKAVGKLMPRLNGGHVIVTARASNFPASLPTLELDVLDEAPATQFLLERTRGKRVSAADDEARTREIAHELGCLALGLEQAGAYIAKLRIPFARYLKLWKENREKALAWSDATLTGTERTLATTWVTSVQRLSPESRRLLDRLAMLAPDPIPDSLFDVPVPGEAADYDAFEARAGLADYSLITMPNRDDGAAKVFVVHRLVQDFARRAMSDERRAEALREALGWVNEAVPAEAWDVRTWPVLDPLAPHALAIADRADEAGIAEPTARLVNQLAPSSFTKARFVEAELLYRRVVEINEKVRGPNDPVLATCIDNLAALLIATNRHGEAEPLMRRALAISEALLQPDDPDLATHCNNLAELLRVTNRPDEAEPLYRRALNIDEASLGVDHPNVARDLNNLALLLQATDRLREAEPLMRRALRIDEVSYGPDHPEVATELSNLALLLNATNRVGEAEPLFRRALKINEASLGPDHPSVGISLWWLAVILQAANRLVEAEPLMRRALAIFEASLGADHPKSATVRKNLAALLAERGHTSSAGPPKKGS